ncbi:ComEC family competence protein, partial [bacterium]|nr:ComEC family competence protein [bacterium]
MAPAVCAFALGIAIREYTSLPASFAWTVVALSLVAFPVARIARFTKFTLLPLALLLVGAGWLRLDEAKGPLPPDHVARPLTLDPILVKLRGVVHTDPQAYASPPTPLAAPGSWLGSTFHKTRFQLDVSHVWLDDGWASARGLVRVTVYGPPGDLRYGDELAVTGRARRPPPATNPGELDLQRVLAHRGVHALMTTDPGNVAILDHHRGGPFQTIAFAARGWFRHLLRETLADDETTAAMLCATVLGDRTALDDDLEADFQHSGTMHLLAISGLHVGIVAGMVWCVTTLFGLNRRTAGGVVLATVCLYALATGMTPSVLRATLVTAAVVVSILGRRLFDPLQATALAAIIILTYNPGDLFHVGFQLSFAAVLAILTLHAHFARSLRVEPTLLERITPPEEESRLARIQFSCVRRVESCFAVSLAAWLGTMPLTALVYHTFSPVTVLANLAAVPLLACVLVLGFAHALLALVSTTLAAAPGLLARLMTRTLAAVVETAADLPLAWTYCSTPAMGWVVAYYVLGALLVAACARGMSGRRAVSIYIAGLLAFTVATLTPSRPDALEVTALDVRHGTAVVLRYPDGSTALYDAGT